jgi:tripartite ATP-independent transporter DctM subunit
MAGFPVAFSLAGTALAFAGIGWLAGEFHLNLLGSLGSRYFGAMTNEVLVAVPLFILMGLLLERSKIAEELLETMGLLFGKLRGGLAISVLIVGALLAASTGIVGATVVTMGLLSLPTMMKAGYSPKLATGTICASGTLGQIIPPSIVLILLGDMLQGANTQAQNALGNFAPDPVSVIDLFAGAFIPGLVLVGLYTVYILVRAFLRPEDAPALERGEAGRLARRVLDVLVPPLVLIVAVLGSIIAGVATPTEAAAVGAMGAALLAARRVTGGRGIVPLLTGGALIAMLVVANLFDLRLGRQDVPWYDTAAFVAAVVLGIGFVTGLLASLVRLQRSGILADVLDGSFRVTCMVFVILLGASVFALVFRGLNGDEMVREVLTGLPGGVFGAMLLVMAVMFVLGFFLDFIEITFVVVPIVAPVLLVMGLDPVWLGVMIAINLQTSFLTPPFGFALFYLRGVAPDSIRTGDIYRGIAPFVGIQIVGLVLVALVPGLATWLPSVLLR